MANRVFPYIKTAAPTVNDDTGDGYKVGDEWLDTTNDIIYKAIDVTAGAAIWIEIVGRTQSQTLTNKTLTTPTIADFTNAQHTHTNAAGGGNITGTLMQGCQLIWNSGSSLSVGTGTCYAENGDKIDITSTLTASSLTPSASTWYHVYVYLSSGSPAMEVVTTAPVAWKGTAYSKTGDTSRRYVGSVKSDGAGTPVFYNFEHIVSSNQIQYRLIAQSTSPHRVLSSGTATTATSVSLAGVVPVTGVLAHIRVFNSSDGPGYYGTATLTTSAYQVVLNSGNTVGNYVFITMDANQVIYYLLSGSTTGVGHIDVAGYIYNR